MLSETSLSRMASAIKLRRARRLAADADAIVETNCRFYDDVAELSGTFQPSSSDTISCRSEVIIDADRDALVEYSCTCPDAFKGGPCEHVLALAIAYNEDASRFGGASLRPEYHSSRPITQMIERASKDGIRTYDTSTERGIGTVRIEVTLAYNTSFRLRLRLVGERGRREVMSVADFASRVESGQFFAYGKNLAFTHTLDAFDEASRAIARMVCVAVRNRRSFVAQGLASGFHTSSELANPRRELELTGPEVVELLEILEGQGVVFEDEAHRGASFGMHAVRRADPDLGLSLTKADESGYVLERSRDVCLSWLGNVAVAWDDDCIYLTSEAFSAQARLIELALSCPDDVLQVSEIDAETFVATVVPRLKRAVPVEVCEELSYLSPASLELEFHLDCDRSRATCVAEAIYGHMRFPLAARAKADLLGFEGIRDVAREVEAHDVVRSLFSVVEGPGRYATSTGINHFGSAIYEGADRLRKIGHVTMTERFLGLRHESRPRVRVSVAVRSNLLDLVFDTTGVESSEVPALIESYREHKAYHRLSDGTIVRMDDADIDEAANVASELGLDPVDLMRGSASLPGYEAFVIDGMVTNTDASFDAYLSQVKAPELDSFKLPESMKSILRPYQEEGVRWLCGLSSVSLAGVLADEMGLGKTVQLICYLLMHKAEIEATGPALVVCPASLVYNWQQEIERFAPELKCVVVAGGTDQRQILRGMGHAHVFVTSYDLLRNDVDDWCGVNLWCMALDEAQNIKNPSTHVARAAKSVGSLNRVALTGTPVENRLAELWSIFDFLMPGLLGDYAHFRERYERPIVDEGDEIASANLKRALAPFILRRTKREVMEELPEKIEEVVRADMGREQRGLYLSQVAELRNVVETRFDRSIEVLAGLTRLRQICCDPRLVFEDFEGDSAKVDTIMTLVGRVVDAGEKVLVFSQFTSYLDILAKHLDDAGISYFTLRGSTTKKRRLELCESFNVDATPVFLISLKAGGTGLNLTGATVVIHADPWWNEAATSQATDRAHRIGQTKDVTVYKVICADTIEEGILDLQRAKQELADSVVDGSSASISLSKLTRADLEELLG